MDTGTAPNHPSRLAEAGEYFRMTAPLGADAHHEALGSHYFAVRMKSLVGA
jgi:hypothetical protein